MSNKILIALCLIVSALLPSCKKYLEVNPKSSLSEKQLFESEVGFQQALSGVYSQMASRDLFGDNLSMGFVSALAQNYAVSGSGVKFVETRALNYSSAEVIGITNKIWNTSYSAIAGANKIILNTEKNRAVLSDMNYALIRAEAIGLRAYLHFELLRMFGPEYTTGMNLKAIPYKTTVDQYAIVPSTTAQVLTLALADLTEAEALLKDKDPILSNSLGRQIKMNYYALKGLEARIRLYAGDKPAALRAAQIVVGSGKFPFVTTAAASASAGFRDRLYLTEQVFCIRVRDIKTWAEDEYFKANGSTSSKLTRSQANFNTLYETTDFRLLYRIEQDRGTPFPSKFWQSYQYDTMDSNRLDQYVPLIRLSEMYYILAEAAPSVVDGIGYLNMLKANRGLQALPLDLSPAALTTEITKEYQKEFYAEGQLFFYYKRKKILRPQFMNTDLSLSKYVLPIPQTELEFNPNY